jgi:phosphatidylglycerophosphate synthase
MNRRELRTRGRAWPRALAKGLAGAGFTPNQVSVLSIAFALGAAVAYWQATHGSWFWLIVAAAGIQLRLVCNLLDGLLAIEGGLKSKTGDLYNEVPDRFGDIAIMLGAGLVLRPLPYGMTLAWVMVVVAILTAYVRLLGGSLGFPQDFSGPMAKQHRMFTLTLGSLLAAGEQALRGTTWTLYVAAWVIVIGAAFTFARRLVRIARQLGAR